MRTSFIDCLVKRAEVDERIFLITADMGFSVFEPFMEKFPDRFINAGVAEQNAVGMASGLALSGKTVYVYSIIPFITMRCFEQIRLDVAYVNANVRLVGVGAGLTYGPMGSTHHSIEDIAIMRSLPNMTVCCPGDPVETRSLIEESFDFDGPIYFRLGKKGEPNIHAEDTVVKIGRAVTVTKGPDAALITTSNMLARGREWVERWAREGKRATLLSMPTVKPLDKSAIEGLIEKGMPIITLEEHNIIGGLGSAVAEVIAESGKPVAFKRIAINDTYSHHIGDHEFLREKFGLSDFDIL